MVTDEPTPEQWAHLRAVLARLSPREVAVTETVICRMPVEVRAQWLAELSLLGVDQAAEGLRSMIPRAASAKPRAVHAATATSSSAKPPPAPAAISPIPRGAPTKASPAASMTRKSQPVRHGAAGPASADALTAVKLPPLSPKAMGHFLAIQAALTPEEAAFARAVAGALSPTELRALIDEFSAMSVPQAVECLRALLAEARESGAA